MTNPNPKNHSFSRISNFVEICERRHAFDALIKRSWNSAPIKRGNHVHDMLEHVGILMSKGDSAVQACERIAEVCTEGYLKPHVAAGYLERALPVFELLAPKVGGLETWFEDVAQLPIVGKIDMVSTQTPMFDGSGIPTHFVEELCVIDHKTIGSPARMKGQFEAKKSLQLKIYCLATGARNACFLYYLPTGAVRGVSVKFTEADLELAKLWLAGTLAVIDSRWVAAKELSGCGNGAPEVDGFNLLPFALADAPGSGLCSPKFCDFWDQCLGATSTSPE